MGYKSYIFFKSKLCLKLYEGKKMKMKIMALGLIFLLSINMGTLAQNQVANQENICSEIIVKNIALLSSTPVGWDKNAATYYAPILHNYTWTVGNKTYKFNLIPILDEDIINGELTTENFDAMLVPGGGVGDEEAITKGTLPNLRPNVRKWKKGIADFIKAGGGYIGYCGGTLMLCDLEKTPETILEKNYHKCTIGVSEIKCFYKNVGNYFFTHFRKDGYKYLGEANYMMWSAYVDHDQGYPYLNGVCFDVKVNRNDPIYDDYLQDTCRARWIGALVI
jgi:hypothetical protein